jgi:hypothetical protein
MVRRSLGHRDADLHRSCVLGAVIALHYASRGRGVFGNWSGVRTSRQRDATEWSCREKAGQLRLRPLATGAVYVGVVAGVIDYANRIHPTTGDLNLMDRSDGRYRSRDEAGQASAARCVSSGKVGPPSLQRIVRYGSQSTRSGYQRCVMGMDPASALAFNAREQGDAHGYQ